jgi:cold-inducible RNA-binding protein
MLCAEGGHAMEKNIYVGNLAFDATEQDLRQLFSRFGEVESAVIITEAATGRPRGFGFVVMARAENAQRAIEILSSTAFMGRTIVVTEARPRPSRRTAGSDSTGSRPRTGGFAGRRESGPEKNTTHEKTKSARPREEGDTHIGSKSLWKRR